MEQIEQDPGGFDHIGSVGIESALAVDQPAGQPLDMPVPGHAAGAAPRCPRCDGVGYYTEAVPFGHPNFGKLIPCACKQAERERRMIEALYRRGNLASLRDKTFASFDPVVPSVRAAFDRAVEYARQPQGWLVLLGGYGVGKTHLAAAVAHAALARGERVLFTVVPDLLDRLRAALSCDMLYDDQFDLARTAALLILDDLGTESVPSAAHEKLYQIVNHRYNESLPTVITSNRSPQDLDPRILSRMCERAFRNEIIRIMADDYRKRCIRGL